MIKCPVCKKEISELDESCPYCNIVFNADNSVKENSEYGKKNNAYYLNIMAYVNIILSIAGAILIWINFGTAEVAHKSTYLSSGYTETIANWYGIFGGVAVLIIGFTLFFLLKTIVDIYWEIEK